MARRKDEDDDEPLEDPDSTPEDEDGFADDEADADGEPADDEGDGDGDGAWADDDAPAEDAAADDDTPALNIFESEEDADDGAAELGFEDDAEDVYLDDDEPKPFFLRPIVLASIGLLLFVSLAVGAAWLTFDRDAYDAAAIPPAAVVALAAPTALPAPAAEEAAAAAEPGPAAPSPAPPTAAPAQAAATPALPPPPAPAAAGAAARTTTAPAAPAAPPAPETPAVAALTPAPDPGLVEQGPAGPLPMVGEDGRQPWKVYARPFAEQTQAPKVAVVIGGLGLSRAATQAAIQQLPPEVTLAFAAYAPNLEAQIAEARAAGHEVILQLPMEPERYPANDPGPHTMLTTATPEVNLERLHWVLARFSGYIGVTNYMGAKMSSSADALRPILKDISGRGLLFLDARETTDGVASGIAAELGMPRVINNTFLDGEASRAGVDARLLELERAATRTGSAIAIGYAYPVTIERVGAWVRALRDKNVTLAPISALARTTTTN